MIKKAFIIASVLTMGTWFLVDISMPKVPLSVAETSVVFGIWFCLSLFGFLARKYFKQKKGMIDKKKHDGHRGSNRDLIVGVLACLVAGTSVLAQSSGDVVGRITDSTGAALPDAEIKIKSETTDQITISRTGRLGEYRTSMLPPGMYEISIEHTGYATIVRRFAVEAARVSTKNFELQISASAETVVPANTEIVTTRSLLYSTLREEKGFGLYSYLLFGEPPNEATRDRYLDALISFINMPSASEIGRYLHSSQLNTTYLPVKGHPDTSWASDLLKGYDYARARALLAKISCKEGGVPCGPYLGGPYIISTTKPLSQQSSLSHHFLFQDISAVPGRIVPLWMDEFMKQAAQPDFWRERSGPQLVLKLRTAIALLSDASGSTAESMDIWKKRLTAILVWR